MIEFVATSYFRRSTYSLFGGDSGSTTTIFLIPLVSDITCSSNARDVGGCGY